VDAPDFTPDWLTAALAPRFPGVRVAGVDVLDRGTATNMRLRLGLTYEEQAGAPDSLFVKLPPLDPAHRAALDSSGMGVREARFYADLAPSTGLRVPEPYFVKVSDDGDFVLLLEDLVAGGCEISDGTWGIPGRIAPRALEDLAAMHASFEDPARRQAVAPWLTRRTEHGSDFALAMMQRVVTEFRDLLTPDYLTVGELYLEHHQAMESLWDAGPKTVSHGDAHIGNVFVDGDRVGFIDWGLLTVSTPLRDVSYFLTMSVDPDDRRAMDRDLLRHYLDAWHRHGGSEITFDDAWETYRIHATYTVIASFLSLVPPYDTPEVAPFGKMFRERSMLALDDLDAVTALRAALA